MAAILPWGLGFSRTRQRRDATRAAKEPLLDKPRPQGSHLTMRFKAGWHLGDASQLRGEMEPESTDLTQKELAAIRRLNAELGIDSPGKRTGGLLVGAGVAAAFGLFTVTLSLAGGPPVMVYGTVQGFGLGETQYGSYPLAVVWVDDRSATVSMRSTDICLRGDRIKLYRRRALFGYNYSRGMPLPCGR